MSSMLTGSEEHFHAGTADRRRAQIAFATYRLLDPRERAAIYERVQLAYPLDRDDDDDVVLNTGSLELAKVIKPSVAEAKPVAQETVATKGPAKSVVKLMNQKVIEEAITEEVAPSEYSTVIQNTESNESIMEERRSIVRELREAEEANLRGLSPLGWLRSRLGI